MKKFKVADVDLLQLLATIKYVRLEKCKKISENDGQILVYNQSSSRKSINKQKLYCFFLQSFLNLYKLL